MFGSIQTDWKTKFPNCPLNNPFSTSSFLSPKGRGLTFAFMENRKIKILCAILIFAIGGIYFVSCGKSRLARADNNYVFPARLTELQIYQASLDELNFAPDFTLFEPSTQLFTDYAEKQRLIRVPGGKRLRVLGDGLFDFPDSTMLVKTFYYYHDKRDTSRGRKIIETRVLLKISSTWNVATYIWNDEQSDALLSNAGMQKPVNWIDASGKPNVIAYHIPSMSECATCHKAGSGVIPIGPKVRSLNFNVFRGGLLVNQLQYLEDRGVIEEIEPSTHGHLPNWRDGSVPLENRARAYLDMNCAHCHNPDGYAGNASKLDFRYETALSSTGIKKRAKAIPVLMDKKIMPKIGTTLVDHEAVELIQSYINGLK